jgi:hypothetical protein
MSFEYNSKGQGVKQLIACQIEGAHEECDETKFMMEAVKDMF